MLVTIASPPQVIDWFHRKDTTHDVMCFFLGGTEEHLRLVESFTEQYHQLDTAMGHRTAFILFDERDPSVFAFEEYRLRRVHLLGKRVGFAGDQKRSNGEVILPFRHFRRKFTPERLKQQAARVSAEFRELFRVKYEDLPVLMIFVKGVPEAYSISLGDKPDIDGICKWLAAISESAWKDTTTTNEMFLMLPRMRDALFSVRQLEDIGTLKPRLTVKLQAMLKRHNGTQLDYEAAANFVINERYTQEAFTEFLSNLSFSESISIHGFTNTRALLRKAERVQATINRTCFFLEAFDDLENSIIEVEHRRQRALKVIHNWEKQANRPALIFPMVNSSFVRTGNELLRRIEGWGTFGERLWRLLKALGVI